MTETPAHVRWIVQNTHAHIASLGRAGRSSAVGVSRVVLQTINRRSCTIAEKAPTKAFSWLKAPTSAFTFKTLLRHYAKHAPKHGK